MKKLYVILVIFGFVFNFNGFAQQLTSRKCGTMDYLSEQLRKDPAMAGRMNQIEQQTNAFISSNKATATTVVIPVVFHIVYNTTAQNISDAQCIAQLNQLNLDYAKLNSDTSLIPAAFRGLAANTQIQFCLAQRDPNGVATTGIIRKSTTTTSFTSDDKVKSSTTGGDNAWPSSSYLNIWSCNLGGGLLGYAQFPGGAAATDGVVLLYSSIGSMASPGTATPYQLGRTATHEVGHWLNLRHIWGDANCGSDLVGDTPTQQTSNSGCPAFPHVTCSNGPNGDMFMNYMDYTNDACMQMFSVGQSSRMNALFAAGGARISLLSSTGCLPVTSTCSVATGLLSSTITSSGATLSWTAVTGALSYNLQYRVVGSATWTSTTSSTNSKAITGLLASSNYEFQVQTVCTSGSSAFSASSTFTTLAATTTCATPTGLTASSITSSGATVSWSAVTGASSYAIDYKANSSATWISLATATTSTSATISSLTASTLYDYRVRTNCTGSTSAYASGQFTTIAATTVCQSTYDNSTNGTVSGAATIPFNTNITGLINVAGDIDYYKFSITKAGTITVTLTNLPADYDLSIVNSTGATTLASSLNSSTTNETINYTAAKGTYYAKVVGYSGAYNTTTCYTLKVQLGTASKEEGPVFAGSKQIIMYPNPAQHQMRVSIKDEVSADGTLKIYNLEGRLLQSQKFQNNGQIVDLSNLSKGFYLMKIYNGGKVLTDKFIKQ